MLADHEAGGTLWSTYGASQAEYDAAVAKLTGTGAGQLGLKKIGDATGSDGCISSAESRTIWLQLSPTDFHTLFGTHPFQEQNKSLVDGGLYGGPGYGNYTQAGLVDVDAGDLIAMRLTNNTSGQTYWGFEDIHGGGDRDFNDLVVQLDFTSASDHGWLI